MDLVKKWIRFLVVFFHCAFASVSYAQLCQDYGMDTHILFPSTIVIQPSATPGTQLTEFIPSDSGFHWQCQYNSAASGIAMTFHANPKFIDNQQYINVDGKNFLAFPTAVKGVVVVLRIRHKSAIYDQFSQDETVPIQSKSQLLSHIHGAPVSEMSHYVAPVKADMMIDRVEAALIKSDQSLIRSSLLQGDILGEIGIVNAMGNVPSGTQEQSHTIRYSSVRIVAPTCLTSDVYVPLPKQNTQLFLGKKMVVDTWIPFTIPVRQCPVGMTNLKFRLLRPTSGFIDESQKIIRPAQRNNAATGIGLQISDQQHQLVQYGIDTIMATDGVQQNFDIPLFVRYAKPSGFKVTPGRIEASVLFELNYD